MLSSKKFRCLFLYSVGHWICYWAKYTFLNFTQRRKERSWGRDRRDPKETRKSNDRLEHPRSPNTPSCSYGRYQRTFPSMLCRKAVPIIFVLYCIEVRISFLVFQCIGFWRNVGGHMIENEEKLKVDFKADLHDICRWSVPPNFVSLIFNLLVVDCWRYVGSHMIENW